VVPWDASRGLCMLRTTLHSLAVAYLCRLQVLNHPWMVESGAASDAVIPEVLTRLRQFTKMNKFKKEALMVRHRRRTHAEAITSVAHARDLRLCLWQEQLSPVGNSCQLMADMHLA
jgi:hypothetical protein